jgi:hypothetical protein
MSKIGTADIKVSMRLFGNSGTGSFTLGADKN